MIKAVSTGSGEPPVEVRFELAARPESGQPIAIKLSLSGLVDATQLQMSITTDPKMQILNGAKATFANLKAGESVTHLLNLQGVEPGVFVADIQLTATIEGVARTMNYAIPVAIPSAEPGSVEGAVATADNTAAGK
ncbi:MAG: hypothetical protein AB7T07_02255 [Steroidobacteraceae bacterium]